MKTKVIFLFVLIAQITMGQTILWNQNYGGNETEGLGSIIELSDGNFMFAGRTSSNNSYDVQDNHSAGYYDGWIGKIDSNGNLLWNKCIGTNYDDALYDIKEMSGGDLIACGVSDGQYSIVKTNSSGDVIWYNSYGGNGHDRAYSIATTSDNGFVATGFISSGGGDVTGYHNAHDVWVVKLDVDGNLSWQKTLGGNSDDEAYKIIETSAGDYLIAGYTESSDGDVSQNHGSRDCWIVKLDNNGNIVWEKTYGGGLSDEAYDIIETQDGNFVVVGGARSNDGDVSYNHSYNKYDVWLYKIDTNGHILWEKTYGGDQWDIGYQVSEIDQNHLLIAAKTQSNDGDLTAHYGNWDAWVLETDGSGNLLSQLSLGGSSKEEEPKVIKTSTGKYLVGAKSESSDHDVTNNYGHSDIWLAMLNQIPSVSGIESHILSNIEVYPNPFADELMINCDKNGTYQIQIFDMTGKEIYSNYFEKKTLQINVSTLTNGMYLLKLTDAKNQESAIFKIQKL